MLQCASLLLALSAAAIGMSDVRDRVKNGHNHDVSQTSLMNDFVEEVGA